MGLVQSNPYKLEDEGNVWLLFYGFKAEYICGGVFWCNILTVLCIFYSMYKVSCKRIYKSVCVYSHLHSSCGIFLFPGLKFCIIQLKIVVSSRGYTLIPELQCALGL